MVGCCPGDGPAAGAGYRGAIATALVRVRLWSAASSAGRKALPRRPRLRQGKASRKRRHRLLGL